MAGGGTSKLEHRGSSHSGPPTGAIVLAGRVIDVDPLRWTCTIRTEGGPDSGHVFYDVPIGGAYLHPLYGEGIYAMPEIGALVQVCKPSEGDAPPFIVAYRPDPSRDVVTSTRANKPSAAGNRRRFNPGDMGILGRDRNGLLVRRGALTEIFGGALARSMYLGRTGTIHSICQVAKLDTFGGSARWDVDRPEKDPDGHKGARLDLKLKEYADDRAHVARVRVGQFDSPAAGTPDGDAGVAGPSPESPGIDTPVFRVQVFADGDVEEADLDTVSSLSMNKGGDVELAAVGTVSVDVVVAGVSVASVSVAKDGTVAVKAATTVTVEGGAAVNLVAGGMQLALSSAGAALGAAPSSSMRAAAGANQVLVDASFSADASAAWGEVVALCTALGLPSTNIAKHVASLGATAYTSSKLGTE